MTFVRVGTAKGFRGKLFSAYSVSVVLPRSLNPQMGRASSGSLLTNMRKIRWILGSLHSQKIIAAFFLETQPQFQSPRGRCLNLS